MHGAPQYCHRPAGYRYSDDDQDYWYRDRQAPAAWEYWDDEDDDAGPADSATGGPLVILTSLAVIGTGIMLALPGPGPGIWLLAHKAAFVLWFGAMTIHVLAYLWRLPRLVGSDLARRAGYRADQVLGGRAARWLLLLTASLLTGLLLAVITVRLAGPWAAVPGPGR